MDPAQRRERIAELLVARMNADDPGAWSRDGDRLVGPGTTGIVLRDHPQVDHPQVDDDSEVDVGFVLHRDSPEAPIVWDCAAGWGPDLDIAIERAVETWYAGTFSTLFGLLTQSAERADHLTPGDAEGLPGWHCIHGPVLTVGPEGEYQQLQDWVVQHPLLPRLAQALLPALDHPHINGIRFLFGGHTAEVRVNGHEVAAASKVLKNLPWPRTRKHAFARIFVLAVRAAVPEG